MVADLMRCRYCGAKFYFAQKPGGNICDECYEAMAHGYSPTTRPIWEEDGDGYRIVGTYKENHWPVIAMRPEAV